MPLRVYNTLTREKEDFQTVVPGKVGIYLCGPTVYKPSHIGHMVGPVIFDCIKRYLTYSGYEVTWVVNITDVDDKLIAESQRRGVPMAEVAEEMTQDYLHNLAAFGVDQIDQMPRATETMDEIIEFIAALVEQGFAYESEGDVYFETGKDPQYGKLSRRTSDSLQGEGGEAAGRKRSLGDFALWKAAKEGQPAWDSPWGGGRPGWHIECSAMSRARLGETFDIHGGGLDLLFPHHENEVAQSECRHGKPMANFWMHNGLMRAGAGAGKLGGRADRHQQAEQATVETKISRSDGDGGLADLVARQGGERLRFFLLRTQYRSTIVFSEEAVEQSGAGLETFYRLFKRYERITDESFYDVDPPQLRGDGAFDPGDDETLQAVADHRQHFIDSMDDDFNSGAAVADLFEIARTLNRYADQADLEGTGKDDPAKLAVLKQGARTLRELSGTLGLFIRPIASAGGEDRANLDGVIALLASIRQDAREAKKFELGDAIRDQLQTAGVTLLDRPDDTEWEIQPSDNQLDALMQLVIQIRADARAAKDFAVADKIRNALQEQSITLEDRAGGTEWAKS
ncbi:MAG: cysteine--tRNA ligase [Planctomycetes bacterium]|nr:cysteine--tRNA ligase [Planctomycetota bacterium]